MSADHDLQALHERIAVLEAQQRRARRRGGVFIAAVVFMAFGVMAADGNCPNGLPFCFAANTPAAAAQVNHNFAQLMEWLERKTGSIASNGIATDGGVNVTSGNLNIATGELTSPRLKTSTAGVTVHNGSNTVAGVDPSGNAFFNSVRVNGDGGVNLPRNCVVRRQTANSGNTLHVACLANEFVVGGGGDCAAGSTLNHSGPVDLANDRAGGWAIDCQLNQNFGGGVVTSVSAICCQF